VPAHAPEAERPSARKGWHKTLMAFAVWITLGVIAASTALTLGVVTALEGPLLAAVTAAVVILVMLVVRYY
jgi:hypothetical protein